MHWDRGSIPGLRMLKHEVGAFLSLLGETLAFEKSNDFSCGRHLLTYGD